MKSWIFISAFIISISSLNAQDPILASFGLDVSNGKVFISWSISSGSTCNGIDILRSSDSISFIEIEHIDGVCGDLSQTTYYSYTDHSPVPNSYNYYKLNLGNQEVSKVLGIEVIDVSENEYILRPNPASTSTELFFNNDNSLEHHFRLFNSTGEEIRSRITIKNNLTVDVSNLESGVYYFQLIEIATSKIVTGKLLVSL